MKHDWLTRLIRRAGRITKPAANASRRLGDTARGAGHWTKAAEAYRDHLRAAPDDGPIWVQLGHMLKETGDYLGAEQAYARAATLLGSNADLSLNRGRLLRLMGDDAGAATHFATSYELDRLGGAEPDLFDARGLPHLMSAPHPTGQWRPVGRIEQTRLGTAQGWALDPDRDDEPAVVGFFQDHVLVGTAAPDHTRDDLLIVGLAGRACGFRFEFGGLDLDRSRPLSARFLRTGEELAGSPFDVSLPVPVLAWLDRPLEPRATNQGATPCLSIITPIHDPRPEWLGEALDSVLAQADGRWELVCVDDGSRDPRVVQALADFCARDDRMRLVTMPESVGIARATNAGLQAARADWVVFMDHDDRLEPEAVGRLLAATADSPDLIYSDEVLTHEALSSLKAFSSRPAFSFDYYLSHPYFVHLVCLRRDAALALCGLDERLAVSADVDFVLRALERAASVAHIPAVLYRWRTHADSQGHRSASQVTDATLTAIRRHLARTGQPAEASAGEVFNTYRLDWPDDGRPALAIIPTKNRADLLRQCLNSLVRTVPAGALDIVVIDHQSDDPDTLAYLAELGGSVRVMPYEGPFNFSRMNNLAAQRYGADYEHLLFLNNDIEAEDAGWLQHMRGLSARPDVGAVGATLLYPDRRIQHAGVVLGLGGFADHVHKFAPFELSGGRNPGPGCALVSTREYSAVTAACMMMRREVFNRVGGFDESFAVGFNDTDLCLRIGALGLKILNDAHAVLIHHESATRRQTGQVLHPEDAERLAERWAGILADGDPFFSPLMSLDPADMTEQNLTQTHPARLRPGRGGSLVHHDAHPKEQR